MKQIIICMALLLYLFLPPYLVRDCANEIKSIVFAFQVAIFVIAFAIAQKVQHNKRIK